jgi:elongation factor 1 alpha-like protein
MSNKRVKSLAADDDDYYEDDDYGDEDADEEELSPEDKEQLRLGTIKVREALGSVYSVPEKSIHDALWDYYYDVGKTVTFLKSEFAYHQC